MPDEEVFFDARSQPSPAGASGPQVDGPAGVEETGPAAEAGGSEPEVGPVTGIPDDAAAGPTPGAEAVWRQPGARSEASAEPAEAPEPEPEAEAPVDPRAAKRWQLERLQRLHLELAELRRLRPEERRPRLRALQLELHPDKQRPGLRAYAQELVCPPPPGRYLPNISKR